jgi:exodeoxyribonuclease V alpha subunit
MQQTTALTDLQSQIERITYFGEESGYAIAKVKIYGNKDLVTCVGNLINPDPGEIITNRDEGKQM